jgi:cell division protein FtsL
MDDKQVAKGKQEDKSSPYEKMFWWVIVVVVVILIILLYSCKIAF